MNKLAIGGIITVMAVVLGVVVVMMNNNDRDQSASQPSVNSPSSTSPTDNSTGFMSTPDNSVDEVQSGTVEMDIKDFAFAQKSLKIKKGTTVTWTNRDDARHDVAPDTESDAFRGGPLLAQGESYSFTFNTAGTYSYICSPHPYMKASVEVVE